MRYQIIDPETGKRIEHTKYDVNEKPQRLEKETHDNRFENMAQTPFGQPDPNTDLTVDQEEYSYFSTILRGLIQEHQDMEKYLVEFEANFIGLKKNGYRLTRKINDALGIFFHYFDHNILPHNRKEELYLFPLLNQRLLDSGEHNNTPDRQTAIDLLEDDHIKFIQLASLAFNLLGLASRLPNEDSRILTYDVAYNSAVELVELLKLHTYREDKILFPLAHKLLTKNEFSEIEEKMKHHL